MNEELRALIAVPAALAVPAVAAGEWLARDLPAARRWAIGAALAPLALGLPVLLLAVAGVPWGAAFWLVEFLWATCALWPRPAVARSAGSLAPLWLAGAVALFVAIPSLVLPFVRTWSDAWFHAGVAYEVLARGVPPQDPNFAGIPLYYPWFYHALVAALGEASRVSPFHVMAMLNAWSAALLVLGATWAAEQIGGRRMAVAAGVVVIFGLNPFGAWWWLARAVVGETHQVSLAWAQLAGTNAAGEQLAIGFHPVHASLLNRLWIGTALTPALAIAAVSLPAMLDLVQGGGRGHALRVLALFAGMLALHPALGTIWLAVVAAGALAVAAFGSSRRRGLALLGLAVVAAGLAYPYVRACSPPGAFTEVRLGFYPENAAAIVLGMGAWLLVAFPALRSLRTRGDAGLAAATALLVGVTVSLLVLLPQKNSQKIPYLAWLLVASWVPAGLAAWEERLRRPLAGWGIALALCLPTSLLYTLAVVREHRSPGVLIRGYAPDVADLPLVTPLERGAYEALDEYPLVTAVIESPRASVNEPAPVLARRRAFCGSLDVYLGNHFGEAGWGRGADGGEAGAAVAALPPAVAAIREEFLVRRGIVDALFGHRTLSPAQRRYLDSFRVPLVLVVRRREVDEITWDRFAGDRDWTRTFGNDEVHLYRWRSPEERQP